MLSFVSVILGVTESLGGVEAEVCDVVSHADILVSFISLTVYIVFVLFLRLFLSFFLFP